MVLSLVSQRRLIFQEVVGFNSQTMYGEGTNRQYIIEGSNCKRMLTKMRPMQGQPPRKTCAAQPCLLLDDPDQESPLRIYYEEI